MLQCRSFAVRTGQVLGLTNSNEPDPATSTPGHLALPSFSWTFRSEAEAGDDVADQGGVFPGVDLEHHRGAVAG